MTREQAKREIDSLDYYLQNHTDDYGEESHTAMMMAMDALEQEQCEDAVSRGVFEQVRGERDIAIEQLHELGYELGQKIEPCGDAISRKDLISHIENQSREWGEDYDAQQILGDIEDMPSVKPQERTGHWITHPKGIYAHLICDKCLSNAPYNCRTDYCPSCGAKMEVEKNG